jgi:hypothetical protein
MAARYEEFKTKQKRRIQLLLDAYNEEYIELFEMNIPRNIYI